MSRSTQFCGSKGGDGAAVPLDPADVIYVNAGATENDNPIVPTCRSVERRAQRQSRMPPAKRWHRRSRRNASLTERARRYPSGGGTIATAPASAGLPPRSFCLIIGGRSSPRLWGQGWVEDLSTRPERQRPRTRRLCEFARIPAAPRSGAR